MTNPREGSGCRVLVHGKRESALYRKIVLKDHRIRGIILLGRIDDAGVLLSLIRQRTDVSAFEEELMSSQFNFAGLLRNVGKTVIDAYQSS
jgi:NAD(P)H-nitrite reductase large subunit